MTNDYSLEGRDVSNYAPLKRLHTLQGKTFVVIDENVLSKLEIDDHTYFEQVAVDEGLLLRIKRFTGHYKDDSIENVRT